MRSRVDGMADRVSENSASADRQKKQDPDTQDACE
jgi:hypothetical protein